MHNLSNLPCPFNSQSCTYEELPQNNRHKFEAQILKPVLHGFSSHSKSNSTHKGLLKTKLRQMCNRFYTVSDILSLPHSAVIHFSSCLMFQDHNFKFSFSLVVNTGHSIIRKSALIAGSHERDYQPVCFVQGREFLLHMNDSHCL